MLQIIVEHKHLVISQNEHDTTNNGRVNTSNYTTIMSIYAFSVKSTKKNDCKASLLRKTFKGTNKTLFFFFISVNLSDTVCRSDSALNEDLVRTCRDTKCLSANKHTDQSSRDHRQLHQMQLTPSTPT